MAVLRKLNVLGNMRLDAPHLRLIESAVAGDFDALAGGILAGKRALIVSGFEIPSAGKTGTPAANLTMLVAGSTALLSTASESGTVLSVPSDAPDEVLGSASGNVSGSFAINTTNYVGIDLARAADDTTVASVRFRDASSSSEFTQQVPLAISLQYVIDISTTDFASRPWVAPVAKIVLDSSGNVVSITDCRQLLFRLGLGGSAPNAKAAYTWGSRNESTSGDAFSGGDKDFTSQHDFNRAIMSRLWELGGGEYWYSPTSDRTMRLFGDSGNVIDSAKGNMYWDGTNLSWKGVSIVFAGSTGWYNVLNDQLAASPGLTDLASGECLYVDLDRTQNATVTAQKGSLASLGSPTIPGSRLILAWRRGTNVAFRDIYTGSAAGGAPATNSALGIVMLASSAGPEVSDPVVPVTIDLPTYLGGTKRLGYVLGLTSYTAGNTVDLFNQENDANIVMGAQADSVVIGQIGSALTLNGNATLNGALTATDNLIVGGFASIMGEIATLSSITAGTTISAGGAITGASLSVTGGISGGATALTGHLTGTTATFSGTVTAAGFNMTGGGSIGSLTSTGDISTDGNVILGSGFVIPEGTTGLVACQNVTALGQVAARSGMFNAGGLQVSGPTTLGAVTATTVAAATVTANAFALTGNPTKTAFADTTQMIMDMAVASGSVSNGQGEWYTTHFKNNKVAGTATVRARFYLPDGANVGNGVTTLSVSGYGPATTPWTGKLYRIYQGYTGNPAMPVCDVSYQPASTNNFQWGALTLSNWQGPAAGTPGPYVLEIGMPPAGAIACASMTYQCDKLNVVN